MCFNTSSTATCGNITGRADLPTADGIGLGVGRRPVQFNLDNKHTLVAGETRSGKSVTMESAMFAVMFSHTPAEVGLVVIDPNRTFGLRKDGLKASLIGSFTNAAHLLRPVACEAGDIAESLNYVYQEWVRRMRSGSQDAPGIVLVIDELMHMAVIGDRESHNYNEDHLARLSQLASQGLKHNIFLVIGAQDPENRQHLRAADAQPDAALHRPGHRPGRQPHSGRPGRGQRPPADR